jgi:predicted lipoprotein with Yx(FWY)xxD motif
MTRTRTRSLPLLTIAVAAALVAAGCGDDDADEGPGGAGTSVTTSVSSTTGSDSDYPIGGGPSDATTTTAAAGDVDLALGETSLGDSLVDGDGRTLYVFANDTEGESACTGACAEAWPPLVVEGVPVVGAGVGGEVSTIERDDGATQVAVDGHALYRFAGDSAPGDENGQGVAGLWNVAGPSGEALG